jgi:protein-disulfide isomerase
MSILRVPVTAADHSQGPANAAATLVEYGDYECPHCRAAHDIVKQIQKYFGKNLRFVFRHFPMSQIHPFAEPAAESAEFAADHGKFWQMHDGLYENQDQLGTSLLFALTKLLGLPEEGLAAALANGEYAPKVRNHFSGGVRSGVNGTPTFFINTIRHDGSYDFPTLAAAIAQHLRLNATP